LPSGIVSSSAQVDFIEYDVDKATQRYGPPTTLVVSGQGLGSGGTYGINDATGVANPDLYLQRGRKYKFKRLHQSYTFRIFSDSDTSVEYTTGVTNSNPDRNDYLEFEVYHDAPTTLYLGSGDAYYATLHILDELPPTGTVSGSDQLTGSFDSRYTLSSDYTSFSSSYSTDSASFDQRIDLVSADGIVSSSAQVTELLPTGVVSGSDQLTSSFETQGRGIISSSEQLPSGTISSSAQVVDYLPSGVISGSDQITQSLDLNFFTETEYQVFSSSIATDISNLEASTVPAGTISGSQQLTDLGFVTGSFSSSVDNLGGKITFGEDISSFKIVNSKSDNTLSFSSLESNGYPAIGMTLGGGLVSSSAQILAATTSSYYSVDGGILSGSIDIRESNEGIEWNRVYPSADNTPTDKAWIRFVNSSLGDSNSTMQFRIDADGNSNIGKFDFTILGNSSYAYMRFDSTDGLNVGNKIQVRNQGESANWYEAYQKRIVSGEFQTGSGNLRLESDDGTYVNIDGFDSRYIRQVQFDNFSQSMSQSIADNASQLLDFNSVNNVLSISDGNQVDLSSLAGGGGGGGGSSIWSTGSSWYYVDADLKVTGSIEVDGRIQSTELSGSLDYDYLVNVPTLVSNSEQVLGGTNIVSGSDQLTSSFDSRYLQGQGDGIISSSAQVLGGTGIISGSPQISSLGFVTSSAAFTSSYDIRYALSSSVATQFSDFDARIDSVESAGVPLGTVSSSAQTIANLPTGTVSGSSQLTSSYDSRYLNVGGDGVVSSSAQIFGGSNVVSSSIQVFGGSGVVSSSQQIGKYITSLGGVTSSDGYTASYDTRYLTQENWNTESASFDTRINTLVETGTPSGTVSSSAQTIENLGGSGVISGSSQVIFGDISSIPSGIISSSGQVVLNNADFTGFDTTDIDEGTNLYYTDERVKTKMDTDGVISSSQQIVDRLPTGTFSGSFTGAGGTTVTVTAGNVLISSSDIGSFFNGDREISQELLPSLKSASFNPGTSGSIIEFLNAVFYPNTPPSITTTNGTIDEYETIGTTVTTVTATDAEGQALTFGTASSYTDDYLRVASNGVMTLNRLSTSASFNTDLVSAGVHGHPITVTATDTFGSSSEKTIYISVTPNSAPDFRETSVAGNIITAVNSNISESAADGSLVKRVYFTDDDADSITINTDSIDGDAFAVSVSSNYLDISVNTGSLNYDNQSLYTFSITASDEHFQEGNDLNAFTILPVSISLVDNTTPVVSDQTLSSINENSANGASVGTISATDTEGDAITYVTFELHQLQLDGVVVASGSYSGTSQLTDPHENPFQMDSSGNVTRRTGVYINSDLINRYIYRCTVRDAYNTTSTPGLITINIIDDTPATLTDNWSAGPYIKESELSGTTIKSSNYGSTGADYNANQSGNFASSNPAIAINSFGNLSLNVDLSGSTTQSGDTIDTDITFTNTFSTTTVDSITIQVVANDSASITFTDQSDNFNTNMATSGTTMVSMSVSDTEDDVPYSASIGGTNASDFTLVYSNTDSSSIGLHANSNLAAGTYTYDISVTDTYSKTTTYSGRTLTVAQADEGTMAINGTLYVIESATNGDEIKLGNDGFTGTQGRVSVSYSPNYGSQAVASFTSSNALIDIDTDGYLTVGNNISGSGNVNGDSITSTISFSDQYGNNTSDTITVFVTQNNPPSVTNTSVTNNNTNQATGSERILRLTLTDSEGDSIPNSGLSFSGYNTTYFTPSISSPNMELNVNSTSVPAGTYSYTANIQDEHGFGTNTVNNTFTINQADTGTLGGDTAIYIIESAESGEVFRDQTGYNAGNAAQLTVSYSPNYGSPVVTEFTSSRQGISVDSSGNLTAGYDFSGSVTSTDYTSTALVSDSTNSTLYGKSLHVNGIKVVQGAATGSQSAVPDAFTEKVAQTIKLMVTSSGADINDTDQANMIGILKGETGTWHSGYPTAQRILRGAGSDYSPNPLIDSNYSSYPGLQNFQDSHATNDMIWYLNSSATSGSGDDDIVEVIEHLMHTIHQYGVRGAVSGSYNALSWDPDTDSDWNTRELYLAIKEAVDDSVFDITGYGDASYNTASTFKLIAKEYLYLLNFNMWEYSSLWDGGSLSPEWNDNSRTPSGIQTNNPLGYALYNKYIKPVLTKPSKTVLQNIFQDGDVGDPTVAGSSGYTPEVGTGLISKITFRDQYDNIGSGSVTATIFGNSSPVANFTQTSDYNNEASLSGSTAGTVTITDTEGNSPFTITVGGTDGGKFDATSGTSPLYVQPTGSLSVGTYTINITVTDSYGESVTLTGETITVEEAADYGKTFIYTSTRTGAGTLSDGNYDGLMGITSENTSTDPDLITGYNSVGPSPIFELKDGHLGDSSITVGGGTLTKRAEVSGSNLDTIISSSFSGDGTTAEQIMIIFPSGSDMGGIPTSMTDTLGGSTVGEYVLYLKAAGESRYTAAGTQIHMFDVDSAVEGFTRWNIIGRNSVNTAATFEIRLIPSSGSAP
jgi:hypothetical protein